MKLIRENLRVFVLEVEVEEMFESERLAPFVSITQMEMLV